MCISKGYRFFLYCNMLYIMSVINNYLAAWEMILFMFLKIFF